MNVLITGIAGFIGYHFGQRLLQEGVEVYGIDNLNDYYDVRLKEARLERLLPYKNFTFQKLDIADRSLTSKLFENCSFQYVVNLAAQAGIRHSINCPTAYIDSNIVGFANLLEGCRNAAIEHLVFASSSSVYGANTKIPFSVTDNVDRPISLYAASKKSNELMAYVYSHLFQIPTTGLRFFTVYGPWGRPDMAYFKFVKAISEGEPVNVYNYGQMERDFTYIDDIVEGLVRILARPPQSNGELPYKLYNIGNHQPVKLLTFIETIEKALQKKAIKNFLPMQPGEVLTTFADINDLAQDIGFQPNTPIEYGIEEFVKWYQAYQPTGS
ncbi:MAG: NAD-dependent epimerase [Aphanocapsa sp. GSE-SYN-MK-11-07L]|jgi:UDP-glucuronate 4-epimerase|nr:NAD-dependent epimerase [Aphanocapsa sp. GSE-SYN-MK-11-07L]